MAARRCNPCAPLGRRGAPGPLHLGFFLVHTVLVQLAAFVLRPTSTYRALELGVPPIWLGVLSACFAVAPLILAVPSGQAVDRFGERRVMVVGAVLVVVSTVAFVLLGGGVAGLVAANVLLGTGHLFAVVGQQALVANATPTGRYDAAFGYYTLVTSVGQALGPGLILVFGGRRAIPDTGAIFLATVGLSVLLLGVTLPLRSSERGSGWGHGARAWSTTSATARGQLVWATPCGRAPDRRCRSSGLGSAP